MLKILKSRKTQERKWMSSTLRREKKKKQSKLLERQ